MNGNAIKIAILAAAVGVFIMVQMVPWEPSDNRGVVEAVSSLDGQWVDRPAPSFELPDADSRQTRRLSEFRGKVVFLNFWASFCEPCRREMPSMERLVRQYRDQGFEMIAISLDPEIEEIHRFMGEFLPGQRSAMTVLWDAESEISQAYGTELLPETYIIDRDGRIIARFAGEYDWERPEAKQLIEALL
jgi:cytochrome c biogenesis protein CcmG, thiol:disulfide interchange protein DsbE